MTISDEDPNAVHAIILTFNEGMHIGRCIRSIFPYVASILVVDSGSTDGTAQIARDAGAEVIQNPWVNYATQLNFGISRSSRKGGWLLRIDADEILEKESASIFQKAVSEADANCDGILVRRRIYFLGRRMRHGAIEPSWQLRLWRNGRGQCEQRWMDEHIIVVGDVKRSDIEISDINLNSLTWWSSKHNAYASREAIDILIGRDKKIDKIIISGPKMGYQAGARRFAKERIYLRIPSGIRAWLYFIYRYIFRLGFLDGREGFYFHLFQGFWYRSLVDAKVFELTEFSREKGVSLVEAIKDRTGFVVD